MERNGLGFSLAGDREDAVDDGVAVAGAGPSIDVGAAMIAMG